MTTTLLDHHQPTVCPSVCSSVCLTIGIVLLMFVPSLVDATMTPPDPLTPHDPLTPPDPMTPTDTLPPPDPLTSPDHLTPPPPGPLSLPPFSQPSQKFLRTTSGLSNIKAYDSISSQIKHGALETLYSEKSQRKSFQNIHEKKDIAETAQYLQFSRQDDYSRRFKSNLDLIPPKTSLSEYDTIKKLFESTKDEGYNLSKNYFKTRNAKYFKDNRYSGHKPNMSSESQSNVDTVPVPVNETLMSFLSKSSNGFMYGKGSGASFNFR